MEAVGADQCLSSLSKAWLNKKGITGVRIEYTWRHNPERMFRFLQDVMDTAVSARSLQS